MSQGNQYSVGKAPSPFKLSVNPGFEFDNSPRRMQEFLRIRGELEALNNQHKQLIGNLDSLSGDFIGLFTNMSNIRNKLNETLALPGLDKMHLDELRKMIKIVDKLNSVIVGKIIPMIDELGK